MGSKLPMDDLERLFETESPEDLPSLNTENAAAMIQQCPKVKRSNRRMSLDSKVVFEARNYGLMATESPITEQPALYRRSKRIRRKSILAEQAVKSNVKVYTCSTSSNTSHKVPCDMHMATPDFLLSTDASLCSSQLVHPPLSNSDGESTVVSHFTAVAAGDCTAADVGIIKPLTTDKHPESLPRQLSTQADVAVPAQLPTQHAIPLHGQLISKEDKFLPVELPLPQCSALPTKKVKQGDLGILPAQLPTVQDSDIWTLPTQLSAQQDSDNRNLPTQLPAHQDSAIGNLPTQLPAQQSDSMSLPTQLPTQQDSAICNLPTKLPAQQDSDSRGSPIQLATQQDSDSRSLPTQLPAQQDSDGGRLPTQLPAQQDSDSGSLPTQLPAQPDSDSGSLPTQLPDQPDSDSGSLPTQLPAQQDSDSGSLPTQLNLVIAKSVPQKRRRDSSLCNVNESNAKQSKTDDESSCRRPQRQAAMKANAAVTQMFNSVMEEENEADIAATENPKIITNPTLEDIYKNRLWRQQMPPEHRPWETIFEAPELGSNSKALIGKKAVRRVLCTEDFRIEVKGKKKRKSVKQKPLPAQERRALSPVLKQTIKQLDDEMKAIDGSNAAGTNKYFYVEAVEPQVKKSGSTKSNKGKGRRRSFYKASTRGAAQVEEEVLDSATSPVNA